MSGVSENQFDPSGKLTRAMLVQMLYNMESRPACDAENAFIDVPVGQWYTDAVIWARREDRQRPWAKACSLLTWKLPENRWLLCCTTTQNTKVMM